MVLVQHDIGGDRFGGRRYRLRDFGTDYREKAARIRGIGYRYRCRGAHFFSLFAGSADGDDSHIRGSGQYRQNGRAIQRAGFKKANDEIERATEEVLHIIDSNGKIEVKF